MPLDSALPDVFLPYQQELWAAIDANQVTVVEKSRRTGYSWTMGAIAAAKAAAAPSAGGDDVLYMGYEKEMTREFIDYVAEFAKYYQAAAGEVEEFVFKDPDKPENDIGAFRIRFASGFTVVALPSVPRALRGKQGLVILDEAAFMDDLAEVLKAALALLIWGGKVVIISTHDGEANPFNALINDIRGGRAPYKVLRLTFNEAVEQGLYRRICLKLGRHWTAEAEREWVVGILAQYRENADEELHVIPNPASGVYLARVLLEARVAAEVPVFRWTAPPGFTMAPEAYRKAEVLAWCKEHLAPVLERLYGNEAHAFGQDFGLVRDVSCIWVLAIGRDLVRRTRLVVELRGVPHEQQRDILFFIADRLPRLRAGKIDAGGNGSYLGQVAMQQYGARIEPLQLSEGWYRENMPPLKAGIEDGTLTLPKDAEILDDFSMLRLVRGVARVPARRQTDEGKTRHGDAAIAAALAYAASRAEPEEYGYEAAPRRPPARSGYSDVARDAEEDERSDANWMGVRGRAL